MPLVDCKTELLHIIIDIIVDDKVYEKEIFFINFFFTVKQVQVKEMTIPCAVDLCM